MNVLDPCAAPAIDRLIIIADDERHAGIACKQAQPGILNCIGILELIDEQVLKPALVMRQQLGVVSPKLVRAQ